MARGFRLSEFQAMWSLQTTSRARVVALLAELGAESAGCHHLTVTAGSCRLATKCVVSMTRVGRRGRRLPIWAVSAEARS